MRLSLRRLWALSVILSSVLLLTACWHTREPQTLDHFKCYVAEGEPVELAQRLRLEDQFHLEEGVEVVEVKYFCNPVKKYRGEEPHRAQPDEDHLTCYMIRDEQRFWAKVGARNQFGRSTLEIKDDQLLCVPTHKIGFEEIEAPPLTNDCPGGLHCCCNQIGGQLWPDCDPGFECRSNAHAAGPNEYINVCVPAGSPANYVIQLNSSQPPFCR